MSLGLFSLGGIVVRPFCHTNLVIYFGFTQDHKDISTSNSLEFSVVDCSCLQDIVTSFSIYQIHNLNLLKQIIYCKRTTGKSIFDKNIFHFICIDPTTLYPTSNA